MFIREEKKSRHSGFVGSLSNAGFTLVELLVGISLSMIVLTLIVSLVVGYSQTLNRESLNSDNSNVSWVAMREITRVIRSGTAVPRADGLGSDPVFSFASSDRIQLYSFLDTNAAKPSPWKININFDRGSKKISEERWASRLARGGNFWIFSPRRSMSKPIAHNLEAAPGKELRIFRFFDKEGNELRSEPVTGLSAADILNIASVTVYLRSQNDPTNRSLANELTNTVSIPNLGISRVEPK